MTFISYAQNFEDVMLHRALKDVDKGCYIDVGAHDPVNDSVTKAFYDVGWRGINIEPVNEWFERLQQDRPDDINLQFAVGGREGEADFYEVIGTGLSTMDESIAKRHAKKHGLALKIYKVPIIKLTTVCEKHIEADIHFLKIDVEGTELSVLKGFNLKKFRPWIIVVESTLPGTEKQKFKVLDAILLAADYEYIMFDGLNRFYIAKEHAKLKKRLMTPPNVFDGFVLSGTGSSSFHIEVANAQQQYKEIESQAQALTIQVNRQDEKLHANGVKEKELLLSLSEKETKLQEIESQAQALTTQVNRQDEKLHANGVKEKELLLSLSEKETKLQEIESQAQGWWLESERLNTELQAVYSSKSWWLTWPLRKLVQFIKWFFYRPIQMVIWLISIPKRLLRWILVKLIAFVLNRPALRAEIKQWLIKYPRIYNKLQLLAHSREVKSKKLKESDVIQKDLVKQVCIKTPVQGNKQDQLVGNLVQTGLQNSIPDPETTEGDNIQVKLMKSANIWKLGTRVDN